MNLREYCNKIQVYRFHKCSVRSDPKLLHDWEFVITNLSKLTQTQLLDLKMDLRHDR